MALPIIVALTIDPTTQPGLGKDALIDFTVPPQGELRFVNVDFLFQIGRELSLQGVFPSVSLRHLCLLHCGCGVALQSQKNKSPPPHCEGVGFHLNDKNDKPPKPSSSTPSCVTATTRATTATTCAIERRDEAGQHGNHRQSTYYIATRPTKDVRKVTQRGIVCQPLSCILV